jgi:hypothetical protein
MRIFQRIYCHEYFSTSGEYTGALSVSRNGFQCSCWNRHKYSDSWEEDYSFDGIFRSSTNGLYGMMSEPIWATSWTRSREDIIKFYTYHGSSMEEIEKFLR